MNIPVLNAGSASLKFGVTLEVPSASHKQRKLASGIVEGIGEEATFSLPSKAHHALHQNARRRYAGDCKLKVGLTIGNCTNGRSNNKKLTELLFTWIFAWFA